ncbi:hypothetical protein B0H14DRAFT_2947568, partial [Mycena olivaceomarginata]
NVLNVSSPTADSTPQRTPSCYMDQCSSAAPHSAQSNSLISPVHARGASTPPSPLSAFADFPAPALVLVLGWAPALVAGRRAAATVRAPGSTEARAAVGSGSVAAAAGSTPALAPARKSTPPHRCQSPQCPGPPLALTRSRSRPALAAGLVAAGNSRGTQMTRSSGCRYLAKGRMNFDARSLRRPRTGLRKTWANE